MTERSAMVYHLRLTGFPRVLPVGDGKRRAGAFTDQKNMPGLRSTESRSGVPVPFVGTRRE
ncbi:MAG: hypothetical protein MUC60_06240 [Oscillatoria sp. Prado101]|nr:hypothetical protein [Oscillatoria sp. Prado101]